MSVFFILLNSLVLLSNEFWELFENSQTILFRGKSKILLLLTVWDVYKYFWCILRSL